MDKRSGRAYKKFRAVRKLLDNFARIRHFRGHGVHSPFVYNIVRNVFMRQGLIIDGDFKLYDLLKSRVDDTVAIQLQNLATTCGYSKYVINNEVSEADLDFAIYTTTYPIESTREAVIAAKKSGTTVVILNRDDDREFEQFTLELNDNHTSTIIEKRAYLLIYNNHLPKQRYIL